MKRELLTIACLLISASAAAQTNAVTTIMGPAPNQTLRQRATEVFEKTTDAEPGQASDSGIERRVLKVQVTADLTSTVGAADDRGRYEARVVCDSASATATLNGNPMPAPDLRTDEMVGRAFTMHFGEHGEFRWMAAEESAMGASLKPFSRMLTDSLAIALPQNVAVGETVTVFGALPLSQPETGAGISNGLILTGDTRYTLTSITFDGADRIAHFRSKINSTSDLTLPTAGSSATVGVKIHVTGEGTSDVNLDRGIVLRHEMRVTTDSVSDGGTSALGRVANLRINSTVTLTVERIQ